VAWLLNNSLQTRTGIDYTICKLIFKAQKVLVTYLKDGKNTFTLTFLVRFGIIGNINQPPVEWVPDLSRG